MMRLRQLQIHFQSHLLMGNPEIESAIVNTEAVSIQSRLQIYRHAYQARLIEALTSNFPCLYAHLGHEAFANIALDYIDAHPSTHRSIRWFGDNFPNFLKTQTQSLSDYLAELAEFEWKMTVVFDASDAPVFQLADMLRIPSEGWGEMKLVMHPSAQRMNLMWNVADLWETIMNDLPPIEAVKLSESTPWILWRKNQMNRFYQLSQAESFAIDAILNGMTFGELCEGLCQWHAEDQVGLHAASLIKGWIEAGLITKILF